MDRMFSEFTLGSLKLNNRFIFPPVKTAYGNPQGIVTNRQLTFPDGHSFVRYAVGFRP